MFCPDEATAQACAAPISLGHPGWVLRPLTICPERLPAITDPDQARQQPEMTVLSAPVHADGPHAEEQAQAARRYLGEEGGAGYVEQARHPDTRMARIALHPSWVGVLDFQDRFPGVMSG